jgi:hypothetical protein
MSRDRNATARAAIAAVTCSLTFDDRQLEHILDDADCWYLAGTLAGWCAELLTHLAAHDCPDAPIAVLRHAGLMYSEDEGQVA